MSRRSRSSNVRGPNSALTEFLRVEGITDAFRRRREREEVEPEVVPEQPEQSEDEAQPQDDDDDQVIRTTRSGRSVINVEEDDEIEQMRVAARRKRRAAGLSDDESDINVANDDDDDDDFKLGNEYKIEGEEDDCIECGKKFNLSVYSRYDKLRKGYLCEECNEEMKRQDRNKRKNQMSAKRKRKRVAQALLDKTFVKIPSLQDICINRITNNIDQVETLGDIGNMNLTKISQILSKNRSLNDSTMSLFLNPNLTSLQFWDCSNVASDSFNKIASYCPNLSSLTLFMCGQFHNDNLIYFNDKLSKLTELNLNGPFLISDSMWQEFFETGGSKISRFEIRNTHRFGNDSLISLLENCGINLTSLKLSRLDGIDSKDVYELIPHYLVPNTLQDFEISYPKEEDLVSDEMVINVLSMSKSSLTTLNLDGCSSLTDILTEELSTLELNKLTSLSMRNLDQINSINFDKFGNGGLMSLNLCKCVALDEKSVYSVLSHSCHSLVELNLNSIEVSKNFLWQILTNDTDELKQRYRDDEDDDEDDDDNDDEVEESDQEETKEKNEFYSQLQFPNLTSLDIGFVRAVDDQILNLLSKTCPKLKYLEVFGDNRCTHGAKVRDDLIIIGRQGDLS